MLDAALAQLILDHIDTVAVFDAEGRYLYVNKGWIDWIGLQSEEVIGRHVKEVVPDSKMELALKSGQPVVGEFLFKGQDGSNEKMCIVTYYPILQDGRVVAGIAFSIFKDMGLAFNFQKRLNNLSHEVNYLKDELRRLRGSRYTIEHIIGGSPAVNQLRSQIYQAARSNSTVLIEGETGTGKELVAHAIHHSSQRSAFPFIAINCAAIPDNLLESELFGYEEGAFTGAVKGGRPGKFEIAHMGSLFLDEINQLPSVLQPKLLRVLQEQEIDRIGGKTGIPIDVRVIAASNSPLLSLVKEEKFRRDLFYRFNVLHIYVPPLRERKEDLPELIQALLKRLSGHLGVHVRSVTPAAISLLARYDWPGNIRELQNVLERAMNSAWSDVLDVKHFEWFIESKRKGKVMLPAASEPVESLKGLKDIIEKEAIIDALATCENNKVLAAQKLQISRTMLYKKLKKLGIAVN